MGYDNLERISASIFRPCENIDIKAVVRVAHKNKDGFRQYAHMEYDYNSNFYANKKQLKSIKLNFETSIVIEVTDVDWTNSNSVKIGYIQLPIVINKLKEVVNWFQDEKYDKLYYYEKSDLRVNKLDFSDLSTHVVLAPDKYMVFTPAVIVIDGIQYEGVQILINNHKCIGYITVDYLFSMFYIFKHINLFEIGLSLMSYIGRPEFDQYKNDVVSQNNFYANNNVESSTISCIKKDVPNKMLNGFFK